MICTYYKYHWCGRGRSKKEENYLGLSKGCCISNTFSWFENGMFLLCSETVSSTWSEMMACKKVNFDRNLEQKQPFRFTLLILLARCKKWKREVTSRKKKCVLLQSSEGLCFWGQRVITVLCWIVVIATCNTKRHMRCQISKVYITKITFIIKYLFCSLLILKYSL